MYEPTDPEELHAEGGEEEDPNEAAIAWAEEIRSRVDDVRQGRVKLVPGSEIGAMLRRMRDGADG